MGPRRAEGYIRAFDLQADEAPVRVPSRRMAQQFDMASSSGIPAAINLRSSVIANLQKSGGEKKH